MNLPAISPERTLDDLESRGVLQPSHRMALDSLLDPIPPIQEREFMNEDMEKGIEQGGNDYTYAEPRPSRLEGCFHSSAVG